VRAPRAASAPRERPGSAWSAHSRAAALTATEVKATILALLDDVAAGDEVEITKHGRVVARLVPAPGPHRIRGALAGTARSAAGDDELFATGAS